MTDSAPTSPAASEDAPADPLSQNGLVDPPDDGNVGEPVAEEEEDVGFRYSAPEVYDPAEYRWVPVKRRPRLDGWTEEKQRRFIEALADTGMVRHAAKSVGMTPESAYKLRRAPYAAAFARAWDAARAHAGSMLEDVAFERAIEGSETQITDLYGDVVATRNVPNDRMLMFLMRNLLPERYGKAAPAPAHTEPPTVTLEASLREMEPQLPAPAEEMFAPAELENELLCAEIMDGTLSSIYSEQGKLKTAEQLKRERWGEQDARGEIAWKKEQAGGKLDKREFADMCRYLDPAGRAERPKIRYR